MLASLAQAAEAVDTGTDFANPLTWLNWGVLGLVVLGFMTDRIHTRSRVEREIREREADRAAAEAREQRLAEAATAREERLIAERDRANAERDEAYQVVRDFNQMAAGLIHKLPTIGPDPRPRRGGEPR
jgi:hypothetical protein